MTWSVQHTTLHAEKPNPLVRRYIMTGSPWKSRTTPKYHIAVTFFGYVGLKQQTMSQFLSSGWLMYRLIDTQTTKRVGKVSTKVPVL